MSAIIGTPQYVDYFDNPHGVVQGAIGSALVAGSVIGSLFAGPLSDRIGRRDAISGACFFWLAGTAVQVSCNGIGMLIAGRVLNDVCVGVTSGYPILGREKQAIDVLAGIQANGNNNEPLVVAEWEEITTVLLAERSALKGWRKFTKNGMWRRTFGGMSVQAWQQLSGANVMIYNVQRSLRFPNGRPHLVGHPIRLFIIFTSIIFFLATGICQFVVGGDLGSYGSYVPGGLDGNLNFIVQVRGAPAHAVIAFSYLLIIVYDLTLAPIPWVYAAEVWSLETRATGMALASAAKWPFNFALGLFVLPAFGNISWKTFLIFGSLCFGAVLQAFLFYPETACKSLEDIELMFSPRGRRPWNTRPGEGLLDGRIEALLEMQ